MTPLDLAHDAMEAAPENQTARLRFYERLADSELFLMLEAEPAGEVIAPKIFPVEDARYALVFDRIERLAEFANEETPYAAILGRSLAQMLSGQGLGLGVNLGVAPSSILVPAAAIDWLNQALANETAEVEAQLAELTTPYGIPPDFLHTLDAKLAAMPGAAQSAYLAGTVFDDGTKGLILGFIDAPDAAHAALRQAVTEAVSFSAEPLAMDITFLTADSPLKPRLEQSGLKFDIPTHVSIQLTAPKAPGMDPASPPKLR
ncbi:MAG: SseB family protein [Rhodobacter sp.]|jgi:hypothetical protein|nr:SseB family protein [Rhodobacter sp.]